MTRRQIQGLITRYRRAGCSVPHVDEVREAYGGVELHDESFGGDRYRRMVPRVEWCTFVLRDGRRVTFEILR